MVCCGLQVPCKHHGTHWPLLARQQIGNVFNGQPCGFTEVLQNAEERVKTMLCFLVCPVSYLLAGGWHRRVVSSVHSPTFTRFPCCQGWAHRPCGGFAAPSSPGPGSRAHDFPSTPATSFRARFFVGDPSGHQPGPPPKTAQIARKVGKPIPPGITTANLPLTRGSQGSVILLHLLLQWLYPFVIHHHGRQHVPLWLR